ncbi:hypothetical protein [Bradyrhizobium cosmicum]|uniref:hypothetical protein n=1 Tax=Bradyrhizobium cosmicum TaxID=1404864 RepID=UPI0011652C5A|nr:hypothetical protein [Bradyrhizobium cosmicum]QDP26251.1 hypothetical protein FNV92_30640 [Bradyrhizobium cosmicum]
MTSRELLKRSAFAKRNPEWHDNLTGANIAIAHAHSMLSAGKLTPQEFKDYEAHLWHQLLDEMPMDVFSEMQADGSLKDLEALARGYDGDRDSGDVTESRKSAERKVKADALEQKWLDGTIDDKTYAQLSRDHVGKSERLDDMIADGKHDKAAHEVFERSYNEQPNHEHILTQYLRKTFGGNDVEAAEKGGRTNWEKATDKNGVTDLDALETFERESESADTHPGGYVEHDESQDLGSMFSNNPNRGDEE